MDAGISPQQARAQHRYELRTLTYVTLDEDNGGIVRNLSHEGIRAQLLTPVRPKQQLRVRFELKYPKLFVVTRGEVIWANFSGQCGIRFLDLSPRMSQQINEWIFGNLLEGASLHTETSGSIFVDPDMGTNARSNGNGSRTGHTKVEDGLIVSPAPLNVIEIPPPREVKPRSVSSEREVSPMAGGTDQLEWLSQPLSGRGLAWTVHGLVVLAGMFLFALIFLSVNGEPPKWPLAMVAGEGLIVAGLYWLFFQVLGGASLGARLARLLTYAEDGMEEENAARFR